MHWAYRTSDARSGGVRSFTPARRADDAAARYSLHEAVPLWTALESDCAEPGMAILITLWESIVGSG